MPTNFDRFRFLNDSGRNAEEVKYGAYGGKNAEPGSEVYDDAPIDSLPPTNGPVLPDNNFIDTGPPGPVTGIRSVKIKTIQVASPAGPPNPAILQEWLLTSEFEAEDELRAVEILVAPADPQALQGPPYLATARLFFADTSYEERQRFFG